MSLAGSATLAQPSKTHVANISPHFHGSVGRTVIYKFLAITPIDATVSQYIRFLDRLKEEKILVTPSKRIQHEFHKIEIEEVKI